MSLDTNINEPAENKSKGGFWGFFERNKIFFGFYIGLLMVVISAVGLWEYKYPSATWRYKLTVSVETPEGIKTGSAVREVYAYAFPGLMGVEAKVHHHLRHGEAVVVDMGHGKYLFAIMDVDGSYRIVRDTFPFGRKSDADYVRYYKTLKAGPVVVAPPNLPTLVAFKDINDPKTVTQIDRNNLSAFFGEGVKLKDITIEMTDEDVTLKIEGVLGWLSNVKKGSLDGSEVTSGSSYANALHIGHFKRGE